MARKSSSTARVRRYPYETYEVVFTTFRGLWVWNASGVGGSKCIEDDLDLMDDESFDGFPDLKAAERHAAAILDEYEDEKGRWGRHLRLRPWPTLTPFDHMSPV